MKSLLVLVVALAAGGGCTLLSDHQAKSITEVSAVVDQYGEELILCPPSDKRRFVTSLVILTPVGMEGRLLSVISSKPLSADHAFRKKGARLKLRIQGLEEGRGTSLVPAEGITHIIYSVEQNRVRIIEEEKPDQSLQPTPGAGAPLRG